MDAGRLVAVMLRAYDRKISGLAAPYGVIARQNGRLYQFERGSFAWSDPSRVKLLIRHDSSQIVGRAAELTETAEGLFARFRVANGARGDRALALVRDGVFTGLSVGLADDAEYDLRDDVYSPAVGSLLVEISLTPTPAYDAARLEKAHGTTA